MGKIDWDARYDALCDKLREIKPGATIERKIDDHGTFIFEIVIPGEKIITASTIPALEIQVEHYIDFTRGELLSNL